MKNLGKIRNDEGITLIALVVTIIILLILAGVTLKTVLSDEGLIDKTKEAIGEHEKAQEKEKEELEKAVGMMGNLIEGLGSTGGTTPPTGNGTESSEVAENLKEYQGKYVDIGLDINDKNGTADDWELFYATDDRIFLIAADYVPVTKLTKWGILGPGTKLGSNGFTSDGTYVVYWNSPKFLELPTEGKDEFLMEVMHKNYNLDNNKTNNNSIVASQLLNKEAWSIIKDKTSEDKKSLIDYVIGGPTLEMWCAAWNRAVNGDKNVFVDMNAIPQVGGTGYKVNHGSTLENWLYMNGTQNTFQSSELKTLGDNYKTFFSHLESTGYNGCYGYWLASPSASNSNALVYVSYGGSVGGNLGNYYKGMNQRSSSVSLSTIWSPTSRDGRVR